VNEIGLTKSLVSDKAKLMEMSMQSEQDDEGLSTNPISSLAIFAGAYFLFEFLGRIPGLLWLIVVPAIAVMLSLRTFIAFSSSCV
jgi:hypothetical protein